MKKSPSFMQMMAAPTVKGSQLILYLSSCVTQILKSSRGRYKIFGMIQYTSGLYKDCMIDYLNTHRIREWTPRLRSSKILHDSMRSGRKVFRLLKWIEEAGSIDKVRKKNSLISFLELVKHIVGIFYYVFDNIVWISDAGVINKYISDHALKWETARNISSLLRYFLLFSITLLKRKKIIRKEQKYVSLLMKKKLAIKIGSEDHNNIASLFETRYERRYSMLSIFINLLRIFMMYKVIKLPGSSRISMIFHDVCGIISYALGIAKLLAVQYIPSLQQRRIAMWGSYDNIFK